MSIAILVPVLGRAKVLRFLAHSIESSTESPWRLHFLCSPGDDLATERCITLAREDHRISVRVVSWEPGPGDFAHKTTCGIADTAEPWLFFGATDLEFTHGWDAACLARAEATGRRVIGCRDGANPLVDRGRHATHMLVARSYIEEHPVFDEPGAFYSSAYDHQSVDVEAYEQASELGEFAFAADALVKHHHPFFGGGVMDPTYEKALRRGREDRRLYVARRRQRHREARSGRSLSSVPTADRAESS